MSHKQQNLGRVLVRRARPEDLRYIMPIERASFATPWSEESMRSELSHQDGAVYYVVESDGSVEGYVGAWMYSGEAHILTIAIAPARRGQGLGELLMLTILEHAYKAGCDSAVLEYRVSNKIAEALYLKLGFRPVAVRPGYYTDNNEDAVCALMDDLEDRERQRYLATLRHQWESDHGWTVVSVG